jgi:hypothetical protein
MQLRMVAGLAPATWHFKAQRRLRGDDHSPTVLPPAQAADASTPNSAPPIRICLHGLKPLRRRHWD